MSDSMSDTDLEPQLIASAVITSPPDSDNCKNVSPADCSRTTRSSLRRGQNNVDTLPSDGLVAHDTSVTSAGSNASNRKKRKTSTRSASILPNREVGQLFSLHESTGSTDSFPTPSESSEASSKQSWPQTPSATAEPVLCNSAEQDCIRKALDAMPSSDEEDAADAEDIERRLRGSSVKIMRRTRRGPLHGNAVVHHRRQTMYNRAPVSGSEVVLDSFMSRLEPCAQVLSMPSEADEYPIEFTSSPALPPRVNAQVLVSSQARTIVTTNVTHVRPDLSAIGWREDKENQPISSWAVDTPLDTRVRDRAILRTTIESDPSNLTLTSPVPSLISHKTNFTKSTSSPRTSSPFCNSLKLRLMQSAPPTNSTGQPFDPRTDSGQLLDTLNVIGPALTPKMTQTVGFDSPAHPIYSSHVRSLLRDGEGWLDSYCLE